MNGFDFQELVSDAIEKGPQLEELWQNRKTRRRLALELRGARLMAGLTERELAESAGVDEKAVIAIESRRPPLPEEEIIASLIRLCEAERAKRVYRMRHTGVSRMLQQRSASDMNE